MKEFGLKIITGENRSPIASGARVGLSLVEPVYAGVMCVRNACYDRGIFKEHGLGRPTISVGNITTGGTGKTPVVQWLAQQLRARGHHPAILLRGYGSTGGMSDEATLLDQSLNGDAAVKIPVQPNPSRVDGAAKVLADHSDVTHFILDDGFQHRRAKRSFNLVLISATNPFGYGHVLPRGLLREPLSGLARAHAFLIMRCSLVPEKKLQEIEHDLSERNPATPIFHSDHVQTSIWFAAEDQTQSMDAIRGKRVLLTAGIGDPAGFMRQISDCGAVIGAALWWPDHHVYAAADAAHLSEAARSVEADMVLTTQKDWVKMHAVWKGDVPVGVVNVEIRFHGDDGPRLLDVMMKAI